MRDKHHNLSALLGRLRRRLTPWDPDWTPRGDERRRALPARGQVAQMGRVAEDAVARHLFVRGYSVLARNVVTRYGEIDIVALGRGRLLFVEVRSYRSGGFAPASTIGRQKIRRLVRAAYRFRALRPELRRMPWVLKLAQVECDERGRPKRVKLLTLDAPDRSPSPLGRRS